MLEQPRLGAVGDLALVRFSVSARTSCVIAACSVASSPGADAIREISIAAFACSFSIFGSSVSRAYASMR